MLRNALAATSYQVKEMWSGAIYATNWSGWIVASRGKIALTAWMRILGTTYKCIRDVSNYVMA